MENKWRGYACESLQFENHDAIIVYPEEGNVRSVICKNASPQTQGDSGNL